MVIIGLDQSPIWPGFTVAARRRRRRGLTKQTCDMANQRRIDFFLRGHATDHKKRQ